MTVFLLSAGSGFLFWLILRDILRPPRSKWSLGLCVAASVILLAVAVIVVYLLAPTLAGYPRWFGYPFHEIARAIAGRNMALLVLGFAFGALLRDWSRAAAAQSSSGNGTTSNDKVQGSFWSKFLEMDFRHPLMLFTVAIAAIPPGMIGSIAVKDAKIDFAQTTPSERTLNFEVRDEDFQVVQNLARFLDMDEKIRKDIEYLQLIDKNKNQGRIARYEKAHHFAETLVVPLVKCADRVHKERHGINDARAAFRHLRLTLRRLLIAKAGVASPPSEHDLIDAFRDANRQLYKALDDPLNPAPDPYMSPYRYLNPCAQALRAELFETGKPGLNPLSLESLQEWPEAAFGKFSEIRDTPYLYQLLAGLLWLDDNVEGALTILENQLESQNTQLAKEFEQDLNVNYLLVILTHYNTERGKEGEIKHLGRWLKVATDAQATIQRLGDPKNQQHEELRKRYEKSATRAKNALAYMLTRIGESPGRALLLAREVYEAEPDNPQYIDTFGYVRMAVAVRDPSASNEHKLKELNAALALFTESRHHIDQLDRNDPKNRQLTLIGRFNYRAHTDQAQQLRAELLELQERR